KDGRAGTDLVHRAAAGDQAGERVGVASVERQSAVVRDIAGKRARGSAVAKLQRAGRDRRAAAVAAVGCQNRGAGADLRNATSTGDRAAKGQAVRTVEGQGAVIGHV